jgi:hypothetical protein
MIHYILENVVVLLNNMNDHRSGRPIARISGSCVPVLNEVNECEILGFRSGVADVSVLLEYDAASIGNPFPTFRGNVVVSYSGVKMRPIYCQEMSGSDCLVTPRRRRTDAEINPLKTKCICFI